MLGCRCGPSRRMPPDIRMQARLVPFTEVKYFKHF
jgi:hypothetical protein